MVIFLIIFVFLLSFLFAANLYFLNGLSFFCTLGVLIFLYGIFIKSISKYLPIRKITIHLLLLILLCGLFLLVRKIDDEYLIFPRIEFYFRKDSFKDDLFNKKNGIWFSIGDGAFISTMFYYDGNIEFWKAGAGKGCNVMKITNLGENFSTAKIVCSY